MAFSFSFFLWSLYSLQILGRYMQPPEYHILSWLFSNFLCSIFVDSILAIWLLASVEVWKSFLYMKLPDGMHLNTHSSYLTSYHIDRNINGPVSVTGSLLVTLRWYSYPRQFQLSFVGFPISRLLVIVQVSHSIVFY